MKKVLKNILKWLICVFLTFTVFFTISQAYEIGSGLYFRTECFGNAQKLEEMWGKENIEEMIEWYDEITEKQFSQQNVETNDVFTELYPLYPAGVTRTLSMIAQYIGYGNVTILSLTFGVIIGTAIFMLMEKDKKGLKMAILIYIISIVILGFVQGFINISGEELNLLEYWMFPDEYIKLISVAFGVVVIVRYIRKKEIANKLNERLKQIKEEKNKFKILLKIKARKN